MTRSCAPRRFAAVALATTACVCAAVPAPASALNALKPICGVAGVVSSLVGRACGAVQNPGRLLGAGKQLLTGHFGGAVKSAFGATGPAAATTRALGFAALAASAVGGARFALRQTDTVLNETTSPQLRSTWFSATYWRMAAISAVLTVPFLFAAAVQALMRADLALLIRAAFGYLPLSMLAVGIAAPLTTLLLAAADELARFVSSASGNAGGQFLDRAAGVTGFLTAATASPFLAFLIGVFTVAGALVLWVELLMRATAVYVIVLMLPLGFAAMVWPARRVWAMRAVEILVALILSKFAIVAVLSLGGAAMNASIARHSITGALAGLVLLVMGAFMPWALLRLIPLAELAAGAAGSLRGDATRSIRHPFEHAAEAAHAGHDWARSTTAQMRRESQETGTPAPGEAPSAPPPSHPPDTPAPGSQPGAPVDSATEPDGAVTDAPIATAEQATPAMDNGSTGAAPAFADLESNLSSPLRVVPPPVTAKPKRTPKSGGGAPAPAESPAPDVPRSPAGDPPIDDHDLRPPREPDGGAL